MARVAFALVALATVVALGAAPASADEERARAREHFAMGRKLYTLGEYKRAREEFKAAYLALPDPALLYNLGQCARLLGEPEEAIRNYRNFLRADGKTPNRDEVEGFISGAEQEIARRNAPPTDLRPPSRPPPERPPEVEPPTVAPPPVEVHAEETPAARPVWRRWWLWTVIVGVLVAGAAVAVAVVLTQPTDPPQPQTSAGTMAVRF